MKHIEYEDRVMIKESDYKKVIEDIKKDSKHYVSLHIENIYLDTHDFELQKNHLMLRLRNINNDEQELTLKIRNGQGSHIELNETLKSHPEIDKHLDKRFEEYQEITKLVTDRIEVQHEDYLFVLDKNYYNGIIDYNIEIEAKTFEKAHETLLKYCKKYNLEYKSDYPSKNKRALATLKK